MVVLSSPADDISLSSVSPFRKYSVKGGGVGGRVEHMESERGKDVKR